MSHWFKMKIILIHGNGGDTSQDNWIPIVEPCHIHSMLNTEYYEFTDQGHFGGDYDKPTFPEILERLKPKLSLATK